MESNFTPYEIIDLKESIMIDDIVYYHINLAGYGWVWKEFSNFSLKEHNHLHEKGFQFPKIKFGRKQPIDNNIFDNEIFDDESSEINIDITKVPSAKSEILSKKRFFDSEIFDNRKSSISGKVITKISPVHQKFKCNVCYQEFNTNVSLKAHCKSEHIDDDSTANLDQEDSSTKTILKCKFCLFSSQFKIGLNAHMYHAHRLSMDHKCEFCGKNFLSDTSLKSHYKNTHHL